MGKKNSVAPGSGCRARQQAESDLKRATDLIQQKILSQSEFANTQSKYRIAVATEAEAKTIARLHLDRCAV